MRQVREVLRLRYERGEGFRAIAAATGISKSSVKDYVDRAANSGLVWADIRAMTEAQTEARLFVQIGRNEPPDRAPVDLRWVHHELHKTGVTLQLLWLEYRDAALRTGSARPYQYSQFCDRYAAFRVALSPSMRQVHRAGEKAFIDYSGKRPRVVDRDTGEVVEVELFVMVLGASNYTFAEATRSQQLPDFVGSTVRGLQYFGCVPSILVPDQLRSAVTKPHRFDPVINATFAEMAKHYDTVIIPARPRKPRDKAKVETGVLIAQRWILACLRNRTFFGIDELNVAIAELLERLNERPFQKLEGCRRSAFEALDRPAMKPLPATRYVLAEWKEGVTVNIDYCFEFDHRLYSVSHTLVGAKVSVRATASTIEALHGGERVAAHRRSFGPRGTATIVDEHRPKSHRDYGAWPPSRVVSWAESIGPATGQLVVQIMASKPHPEMGFRSCMALISGAKKHGKERLEAACQRALAIGSPTRKSVVMILAKGLERAPLAEDATVPAPSHENVRGGKYFDKEEQS